MKKVAETPKASLVACLFFDQLGRILLLHAIKSGTLRVEPPGGKPEEGESLRDACFRETQEEIGVDSAVIRFVGVYQTQSPEGEFDVHTYLCKIQSGEPAVCEPEKFSGLKWYTEAELNELAEAGKLVPNLVACQKPLKRLMRLSAQANKQPRHRSFS